MKHVASAGIAGVVALLLTASAAAAQDKLDHRVSLDFQDANARTAFKMFGEGIIGGLELVMDPAIDTPVTVRLQHVTLRTALNAICESVGCTWQIEGSQFIVKVDPNWPTPPPPPPDPTTVTVRGLTLVEALNKRLPSGLRFDSIPLSHVITTIGEHIGVSFQLAPNTTDRVVTVGAGGRLASEALRSACSAAGLNELTVAVWEKTSSAPAGRGQKPSAGPKAVLSNAVFTINCGMETRR